MEYWFGAGTHTTTAMTGTGPYTYQITIPSDSTSTLHYIFHAADDAANSASTTQSDVTVTDDDDPVFGTDSSDSSATTGDSFDFGIAVTDNVDSSPVVSVEYWFGSGSHATTAMTGINYYHVQRPGIFIFFKSALRFRIQSPCSLTYEFNTIKWWIFDLLNRAG